MLFFGYDINENLSCKIPLLCRYIGSIPLELIQLDRRMDLLSKYSLHPHRTQKYMHYNQVVLYLEITSILFNSIQFKPRIFNVSYFQFIDI